jgi:hypothetical protein
VAFCSHEGLWWVIYEDTDESEVIGRFEKCFEGPPAGEANAVGEEAGAPGDALSGPELRRRNKIV